MEAATLRVVVDSIDGNSSAHPQSSYEKHRCSCVQLCAAVRRLLREKLVVIYNIPHLLPVVVVEEAHPEHDGPAHGTRVPQIGVRSVEWGIMSTAVLTCYMRSVGGVEDMVFGCRFDDRVAGPRTWRGLIQRCVWNSVWPSNRRLTASSGRLFCRNSPLAVISTIRRGEERDRVRRF